MEGVKVLLDGYGLEDPVGMDAVGEFKNQELQKLYDELTSEGTRSFERALQAGALIEDVDIFDLRNLIERTDKDDIKILYQNLLKGSRNHLRSFARQLDRNDYDYEEQYLSQEEFDRIAGSSQEWGGTSTDPDFRLKPFRMAQQ